MKNKSYFGQFPKNKKLFKKILISVIVVLLIFIPSFLILLNYFTVEDTPPTGDEISVSVYDGDALLFSESEIKQNALPTSLVSIFDSILNGLTEQNAADTSATSPLVITHTVKENTKSYICYFFIDGSDRNFLVDEAGKYYKIAQNDAMLFLTSSYAQSLYSTAIPPKLYSSADVLIAPESAEWYYKNASQKYLLASGIETSENKSTYDMAGALGIEFDIAPDECVMEVYKSGIIFAKINGTDLSKITVTPGTVLNFEITATWKETEKSDFYGTIKYNFDAILRDRADFIVNKTSLSAGDFLVLACTNILDPDKIEFESSPDIGFAPKYFESNEMVYAIIPFEANLSSGTYSLSFTYGAASETIDIDLARPNASDDVILTPEKDIYFSNYISDKAISNFDDILNATSDDLPDYLYFDGAFLDYTENGATETYQFNTRFQNSTGTEDHTLYGSVFTFSDQSGAPIKAVNNGRVINCGYSDHIGNFVVVEHGLGLKTIYAHLGAINVQADDIVLKGQSIGRSGRINGYDTESFLLLTYFFDTPINYSCLSGTALPLYAPKSVSVE